MHGIVIAGTHSGCGKTTITIGMLAALRKKGLSAQSFKAGPDFIDSGIHRLASEKPSRNLDIWMCGEDYVKNCFDKYSADSDISIVEGVMGMYDGGYSTASLAALLNLPVILVVDAYGMAESAGAVVKGFAGYGRGLSGVIFNRVASDNHYTRLKSSVSGVPVIGHLPADLKFSIPQRHLGLVVAEENALPEENIERLAGAVLKHIDMDAVTGQARGSNGRKQGNRKKPGVHVNEPVASVAVAYDKAFCFYYEDNLDLLRDAGAEIIRFSPLSDKGIPGNADAVYIGGGYPELYADELCRNAPMLESVKAWADAGKPLYAECGGLMYLSGGIHDINGSFFRMSGVLPFETEMKNKRARLGYREITVKDDTIVGRAGSTLRGHEFHYSEIKSSPEPAGGGSVFSAKDGYGGEIPVDGFRYKRTLASYIHVHFGSRPDIANNFINYIKEA